MSQDSSNKRTTRLKKNILASFFIKGWSAVIVFLMVPITLSCLGEYKNGVWLTISSVMLWIDNFDIGLGNGMRNRLAAYLAHNEVQRARSLISSSFAMLAVIIIPVMLIILLMILTGDTWSVFNVDRLQVDDFDKVLMAAIVLVCTTFIFKLTGNFYMGMQLPAVNNLLMVSGQTLALVGTYAVYLSGSHSLILIALVNMAAPLVVWLVAFPYTFFHRYPHLQPSLRLISLMEARSVMGMGIQFFVIQIASVVLFMTSNILISRFFSPAMVTPYQIAYRYFSIMLVVFTVICMPFWNATTDAYERHDIVWIRNATRRLRLMTIGILIGIVVMILVSNYVYAVWVGRAVKIDVSLSIAVAAYVFILIYSMRYSYFINGIGKLRIQLLFTVTAALLFIPLACIVVHLTHDITWFIVVMCIVNLPGLVANKIQFNKLINGTAQGLWNR